jgi:hemerythrin superfamily protein
MPNYVESIKNAIGSLLGQPKEDGDAIHMLMADHRRVEALVTEFKYAEDQEKKSICTKILLELTVHAKLEEELVYPLLEKEGDEEKEQAEEALIEHQCVKYLIGELAGAGPGDDKFDAKVKVLGELVKHHVREEEGEMFPELRATDNDMNELGQRLAKRKEELLRELHLKPGLMKSTDGKTSRSERIGGSGKKAPEKATTRGNSKATTTRDKPSKTSTAKSKITGGSAAKAGTKTTSSASRKDAATKTKPSANRKGAAAKPKTTASRKGAATKTKPTASRKGAATKTKPTASRKVSATKTKSTASRKASVAKKASATKGRKAQ